ncbi:hypothetical protein HK100_009044, partial [Physocladia obscura]
MAPLELFGRRLPIAGDDLLIPALLGGMLHVPWLCAIAVGLSATFDSCVDVLPPTAYFALNGIFVLCCLAAEIRIGALSLRGTVIDPAPRRALRFWVPAYVLFATLDFIPQLLGLRLLFGPVENRLNFLIAIKIYLLSTPANISTGQAKDNWNRWLRLLCFGHSSSFSVRTSAIVRGDGRFCGAGIFSCFWSRQQRGGNYSAVDANGRSIRNRNGESSHVEDGLLRDVAAVFADIFGDAESVVSDIFVGLIYVRHLQRKHRKHNFMSLPADDPAQDQFQLNQTQIIVKQPQKYFMQYSESLEMHSNREGFSANGNGSGYNINSIALSDLNPIKTSVVHTIASDNHKSLQLITSKQQFIPEKTIPLRRAHMDQEMEEIIHFSEYAESIYGLPLHMITNWTNFRRTLTHLWVPECCLAAGQDEELVASARRPPQSVNENVRSHLGRP